jgi:hypothetical protein
VAHHPAYWHAVSKPISLLYLLTGHFALSTVDNGDVSKRPVIIARVVVVLAVSAAALFETRTTGSRMKCESVLRGAEIEGIGGVAFEDQGGPGRDGCDDRHAGAGLSWRVLGFDCKIRDPADVVVATTTPNRTDGTCGQPSG